MRKSHHHLRSYYLLGKLLQGFLILSYSFFIAYLLLAIAVDAEAAWVFLTAVGPWILRLGLTFGCSVAILALFEALP